MIYYIDPEKSPSGAYHSPQSTRADGLLEIDEALAEQLVACGGFADFTIKDGAVVAVTPNWPVWDEWQAEHPTQEPLEPEPTGQEARLAALEKETAALTAAIERGLSL